MQQHARPIDAVDTFFTLRDAAQPLAPEGVAPGTAFAAPTKHTLFLSRPGTSATQPPIESALS